MAKAILPFLIHLFAVFSSDALAPRTIRLLRSAPCRFLGMKTEGGTGVGQRSLADDVAGSIQHADVMLTVSEVQAEGEPADDSGSGG